MYDKTVRRRRAVLALLVACSLILLTAFFGESSGGGLHSVQRGVLEVVSPIQDGVGRVLKPVRDLFGWVGDTLDAKGEVKSLRKERDALRAQAVQAQADVRENAQLKAQLKLNDTAGIADDGPVQARVTGQNPSLWFSQVTINQGSSAGVRVDQPVMNGAGLIGRVAEVGSSVAVVSLITDQSTKVGGRVNESSRGGGGVNGIVQVQAGRPTDLVMRGITATDVVAPGQTIVTTGTLSKVGRFQSPYPPNIPIGRVTKVDDVGSDSQTVHLVPFADLHRLELVQVLTRPQGGAAPR
ncbi:MAG: rod shape-determining protein MreC [Actinomycetota bacterium]|nr:rod shape-determining protein MreC [Actinomycetota bacterium]